MDILIVDRHILLRQGLASLLSSQAGFSVSGEACDADEMLAKVKNQKPQVVLVGIENQDDEELAAIRTIVETFPHVKVIVISNELNSDLLVASILAGVKGFIPKNIPLKNLIAALRAVERGEVAFPRKLMHWILDEFVRLKLINNFNNQSLNEQGLETLTARELEVLRQLSRGVSNREIAERLFITENTVRVHVHHILEKLGLQNRSEAKDLASRLGVVEASDRNYLQ